MGRLVTGSLSVDPEAAATKRQIRELETAYRRQNRKLRREAYADGPRGVAAGSERIRLIQDAMSRGIDSTNFGSSEQRGAARDSMTRNLFAEARRMAQDGAASTDLRNQELNARMDDFARSNGNNIAGYSPAARAEYDGLRREALSLAGGFRRASSLGKTGADSASQVQMSRKPGEQEKGGAPDTTTTDQLLKPSNDATGDPSKESGTFAKLTDQQKGIDAGKKNAEQQAAKTADPWTMLSGVKPVVDVPFTGSDAIPGEIKAIADDENQVRKEWIQEQGKKIEQLGQPRRLDTEKALTDRSKQLERERQKPVMVSDSPMGLFSSTQIERSMKASAQARGSATPSKFLDNPAELGGRDGYVQGLADLPPDQRKLKMRQDGLSGTEQALVEGRLTFIDRRKKATQTPGALAALQAPTPTERVYSVPSPRIPQLLTSPSLPVRGFFGDAIQEIPKTSVVARQPTGNAALIDPSTTGLPYRVGALARSVTNTGGAFPNPGVALGEGMVPAPMESGDYSFSQDMAPIIRKEVARAKASLRKDSKSADDFVSKLLKRIQAKDRKLTEEFARGYSSK